MPHTEPPPSRVTRTFGASPSAEHGNVSVHDGQSGFGSREKGGGRPGHAPPFYERNPKLNVRRGDRGRSSLLLGGRNRKRQQLGQSRRSGSSSASVSPRAANRVSQREQTVDGAQLAVPSSPDRYSRPPARIRRTAASLNSRLKIRNRRPGISPPPEDFRLFLCLTQGVQSTFLILGFPLKTASVYSGVLWVRRSGCRGVDPVSWTPHGWGGKERPRCRRAIDRTRRRSGGR